MRSEWTDERVERLKALWAEGLTAREVAAQMGGFDHCDDGGRSTVLGKVHRLNLSGRAKPVPKRAYPPRPKRAKNDGGALANKLKAGTFAVPPKPLPPPEPVHVPYAGPRYGILDDRLGHRMCRAIVGGSGPATLFCSAPTVDGPFRFCRDHAAVYLTGVRSQPWSQERRDKHVAMLRKRGIAA